MKKVICGHSYDSDKAKKLGERRKGEIGAADSYREVLYRTRSGCYFVHGIGGSESRYAKLRWDEGWRPGERIVPLSEEEAREWSRDYMRDGESDRIFSPEKKAQIFLGIRTGEEVKEAFDAKKKAEGKTGDELLRELLR